MLKKLADPGKTDGCDLSTIAVALRGLWGEWQGQGSGRILPTGGWGEVSRGARGARTCNGLWMTSPPPRFKMTKVCKQINDTSKNNVFNNSGIFKSMNYDAIKVRILVFEAP